MVTTFTTYNNLPGLKGSCATALNTRFSNNILLGSKPWGVSHLRLQLAGWSLSENQGQLPTGVQRLPALRLAARSEHLLLLDKQSLHPISMASGQAACWQGLGSSNQSMKNALQKKKLLEFSISAMSERTSTATLCQTCEVEHAADPPQEVVHVLGLMSLSCHQYAKLVHG